MKLKFTLPFLLLGLPAWIFGQAPCTTTNATGCVCKDQGQTDCDLLPDITISDYALLNYLGGPSEYPQTGAGANNGRLRLSGSTPNIGVGPFTVGALNTWVCGNDTFYDYQQALAVCATPKQLIKQKIYHKNGNTMSYTEHYAGTMTYHPTHGHMHVDDWGVFTLRIEDPNDPNPLNWPILGDGAKIGFCLMDYGTCSNYNGHCRDSANNVMLNGNFVNWGLGGGNYGCSPVEQGISVGYTDIYSENLDGMWIDIPPGTCNGDYYIVVEIDPNNNFIESNENNNWTAVPITLTQQVPNGQFAANITASGPTSLCAGDAVTLTATPGNSYAWSTGDTTASITVSAAGTYDVTVTAPCGTATSQPVTVTVSNTGTAPTGQGGTVCEAGSVTLTVNGAGDYYWYDAPTGGNLVGTGTSFTTPSLFATTDYYVERAVVTPGQAYNIGPADGNIGAGGMHASNARYLVFTADEAFTLESVWVNAGSAGNRTVELRDANDNLITSTTVNIPAGQSRVTLNMNVPVGVDMHLGLSTNSLADLYRNNGGVSFPYTVSNVASITTSSAGSIYYYYFYDWEIRTPDQVCATPRTAITASVNPAPTVSFSGLAAVYAENDPPVTLTGSPAGGTFSGPGISGNTFNPSLAGAGGPYTITYTYTDGNGCEGTTSMDVTVQGPNSILDEVFSLKPSVFPNPNNGQFRFAFGLTEGKSVSYQIQTLTGKVVMRKDLGWKVGEFVEEMDITSLAKGVYLLRMEVDAQPYTVKLVHQ